MISLFSFYTKAAQTSAAALSKKRDMKNIILLFLFCPFVASAQVLLSDANPPAADTTHGAAAILTERTITTQLPDGATATYFCRGRCGMVVCDR